MLKTPLVDWVNINSGSTKAEGLGLMADTLEDRLRDLPGTLERIPLPPYQDLDGSTHQPGDVLRFRFNPDAALQVLFSGHMDTVYAADHPFQQCRELPDGRLNGPGAADMKGGLLIMIEAARKFLATDESGNLGGEILINGDDETGLVGSRNLILDAARRNHIGLVFESSLPGGELVRCRKGSGTFRVIAHGKSAHTGRDFENGRNAIVALASLMQQCHDLNRHLPDTIVNVVNFRAAGPVNVVPDRAECWLNVRVAQIEGTGRFKDALASLINEAKSRHPDIRFELSGDFQREAARTEIFSRKLECRILTGLGSVAGIFTRQMNLPYRTALNRAFDGPRSSLISSRNNRIASGAFSLKAGGPWNRNTCYGLFVRRISRNWRAWCEISPAA